MATSAGRPIRDQNLNLLHNGVAPGGKTFRGGLGGRKALNDISNSRNVVQPVKKSNTSNVIPVENDSKIAETKHSRVPEKKKTDGRKPLTDVTNSVEPSFQKVQKAVPKLKLVADANALTSILEEGFLHNHQHCITGQAKIVDKDYFLTSVGLNNTGTSAKSSLDSSKTEPKINSMFQLKIKEIPEPHLTSGKSSSHPSCTSPTSSKCPNSPPPLFLMNWDDDASYLTAAESVN